MENTTSNNFWISFCVSIAAAALSAFSNHPVVRQNRTVPINVPIDNRTIVPEK